jgi:hypothetical protein
LAGGLCIKDAQAIRRVAGDEPYGAAGESAQRAAAVDRRSRSGSLAAITCG